MRGDTNGEAAVACVQATDGFLFDSEDRSEE